MKAYITICVLLAVHGVAEASTLYSQDFNASTNPGWHRSTSGDNNFHNTWAVASSLESSFADQYARFDFSISAEPSLSTVRWWGGFSSFVGDFVSLPPVWELSFRISIPSPEPVRIAFLITESPRTFPPTFPSPPQKELYCWITPSGVGWQQVTIRNSDVVLAERTWGTATDTVGTTLQISLSSHDLQGQPLSISQIGQHALLLDDIVFRIPTRPFVSLHPRPDGKLSLFYSGTLEISDNLTDWSSPNPQPNPHSVVIPTSTPRFFRAIGN
jgi:hypothetical protein